MNPPPVGIIQKSCRAEVLCKSLVPPWHIMNGVDLSKPRLSRLKLDEIGGFSVGSNTMSGGFRGSLERGSKMDLNLLRFFWRNLIHDHFIDPILSFSGSHVIVAQCGHAETCRNVLAAVQQSTSAIPP